MNRFFVDSKQIEDKQITITGTDVNHIKNVLRMKKNDTIVICDGEGKDYYCIINEIEINKVIVDISYVSSLNNELPVQIYLFQGIPKKDKMDIIIQKAVELGVYQIIPIKTKRCITKLDEKKIKQRITRWNTISESAAKQAKRGIIPIVLKPMSFKEALSFAHSLDIIFIPYEKASNILETRKLLNNIKASSIGIIIGPEGGFEQEEVELAIKYNANPITLGKRILRTETASMTILSIIMYNLEEA